MPNLLLVDDRPENLLALEAILEPLGQNLVTAGSGEEALRRLLEGDFACILLDVQMPGMDGFETAAWIKRRERTRNIPIIFLTAISKDEEHVFQGYEVGAVDYVFKPIDPQVLRSKVGVFVELWEKTEQLRFQSELLREQELAKVRRAGEERYRQLADAMPQIVWTSDPAGRATYYNRRWFEYTGMSAEDADESAWTRVVHPDDLPEVLARRAETLQSGETFEVEYRFRARDGVYRWHLGRAVPIGDANGQIAFWIGTATDIQDRKRTEEMQRFLLEAGEELAGSLDYRRTLAAVARLAVPEVADWCSIHIVEDDGSIQELEVALADRNKLLFVRELQERYPPDPDAVRGAPHVIRTGRPELVAEITEEMLVADAVDEMHLGLLQELGLSSSICVPLEARGRTVGALTLIAAESERRFGQNDLRLAQELARRAGAAVDNARLYARTERLARAARVLDTIGDGVLLVDRDGVIRLFNAAAQAILGVRESEVVGRPASDAIPGWSGLAAHAPVTPEPPGSRAETVPVELGDTELWLSISGVDLDEGTVYAFRDLTEERAVDELKSDFVATVSHELRTPLAAIYGAAVTLLRPDLDLEDSMQDRLLTVIADESDRLANIVNDVLLASHLDSGRVQLAIEACDAAELAQSVVETHRMHLPEAVSLELDAPTRLPQVAADPAQLRQVLTNLVDNAIKYSPDGGPVRVEIDRAERGVRFAVRDEGLGVPAAERRRIFEKFYRLDPQMTRGIGGTGLGLYICRELVSRIDGRIWVESNNGKGSVFYVEVPVAETPKQREARPKSAARG